MLEEFQVNDVENKRILELKKENKRLAAKKKNSKKNLKKPIRLLWHIQMS